MPKVPTYDQFTVQSSDAAMPRVSAPDMPVLAGKESMAIGEGMIKAGTALSAMAEKAALEADQIRVIDATNQAVKAQLALTFDKDNGFINIKGKNALERPDPNKPLDLEFTEKFENQLRDIEKNLGNDQQKKLFRQASATLTRQFMGNVNQHVAAEYKDYQIGTLNGSIDVATQKMALDWGTPAVVMEQQRVITAAVAERDKNLSPEQREANLVKALSPGNSAIITAAVDAGNITYAEEFLKQNAANITPENRLVLSRAVALGDIESRVQETAEKYLKQADGDFDKAITLIRENTKGKIEIGAVAEVKIRLSEKDAQNNKNRQERTQGIAIKYLSEANNDHARAITLVMENVKGQDQDDAITRIKAMESYDQIQKNNNREERTQGYVDWFLAKNQGDIKLARDQARKDLSGIDRDRTIERLNVLEAEKKQEKDSTIDERSQIAAQDIYDRAKGDPTTAFELARNKYKGKDQTAVLQLLKTRFDEDSRVDPKKIQTEAERIIAQNPNSIEAQLAAARKDFAGEFENSLITAIQARQTQQDNIRENAYKAALSEAFVFYGKGGYGSIPASVLSRLDPQKRVELKALDEDRQYRATVRGQANADRRERELNKKSAPEFLALYSDLDKLEKMTAPEILLLEPRLGEAHVRTLLDRNVTLQNAEGKRTAKMDDDQFKAVANELGLNPFDKPSNKQKEVLGIVRAKVDMVLEDAAKKKRAPLSREEKADIMRNAFKQEVEIDGLIWNDKQPAITLTPEQQRKVVVPATDRAQIIKALKAGYDKYKTKDYEPTEDNIRRMYIQGLQK